MPLVSNRDYRDFQFVRTAFGRWLLLASFLLIDLSRFASAVSSRFDPCPDVIFSLTPPSRVCKKATLLFGWTAPSNRSRSTVCFFKGNNKLPHGCVPVPAPPLDPCNDISAFMGLLSVPPSLPFWASLVSQGGQAVRAVLASGDCDQTAASDWPLVLPLPNANKPSGCAVHARSDFMVIWAHSSNTTPDCHNGSSGQGSFAGMNDIALTASQVAHNIRHTTRAMASTAVAFS